MNVRGGRCRYERLEKPQKLALQRDGWIRSPHSIRSLKGCLFVLGVDLYSRARSTGRREGLSLKDSYDKDEILWMAREAYREKCKTEHPNGGGDCEKFVLINKAYKRALRLLENW